MRSVIRITLAGFVLLGVWQAMGCFVGIPVRLIPRGGGTPSASGDFDLGGTALKTHQVVAGEETRESTTGTFELSGGSPSGGSIDIEPSAITIDPTGGPEEKATVAFQQIPPELADLCIDDPLIIRVWLAPVDQLDTVFDSDQMYTGEVTLNESCQPTQVDVTPDHLMQGTLDLIEVGEFAIGIGVTSPVTGEVVIDRLSFEFQL
jgi:hypothetical protein